MKALQADDHWIVRSATRCLIDRLEQGSELLEASDFYEALDLASKTSDLDLVLLDLVLPGMKRVEYLQELRRFRPRVPLVVISAI